MNASAPHNGHEFQRLLLLMEQNNKVLERLSQKINSYTCEPNDHACFERLYRLRRHFQDFVAHQNRITQLLNQQKAENSTLNKDIRFHLERFKRLESEVTAYLRELDRSS